MEAGHCGFNNEHIEILCGFRTGSKITFVFYNVLMGVIRLRYNCAWEILFVWTKRTRKHVRILFADN